MPIIRDFPHLLHGGDYNPDQWPGRPDVLDADFRLMDQAGCNAFSVGIFAWSRYEPAEGHFDFAWMDEVFDRAERGGKKLFLATPTGARPAWLAAAYPETGRVDAHGRRVEWEKRHNHCWTSPVMREKARDLDERLAARYAKRPALAGWHLSNEYSGECFCPLCRARFAAWLEERYGTLERLNAAYWSAFWSHAITDWAQVNPLDGASDGAKLDWRRFASRQLVDFLRFEKEAVRRHSDAPVTTNMMGFHPHIDYWRVAEAVDFVADDCYPSWRDDGRAADVAAHLCMTHDLHRAMKDKPFLVMESCPGVPNYFPAPRLRRPNALMREAVLALGHGADGTMYFQWRKGRGGCEKFHGAVVGHDGTDRTRTFADVAAVGRGLANAAGVVDAETRPAVAVVHDWESNWALGATSGFGDSARRATELVGRHYAAFWRRSVATAVIEARSDLSPYRIVAAPMLYMLRDGLAERLRRFVEGGGTLVMTCLSAYVDADNLCFEGGFPGGGLRALFGIWNEDVDGLAPEDRQGLRADAAFLPGGREYAVARMAELVHAEGAEVVATYTRGFMAGLPALTVRRAGRGAAWYLAAETEPAFLDAFYGKLLAENGIDPVLPDLPAEVHAAHRARGGTDYYFLANLAAHAVAVDLPRPMADVWHGVPASATATLPPNGAALLAAPAP